MHPLQKWQKIFPPPAFPFFPFWFIATATTIEQQSQRAKDQINKWSIIFFGGEEFWSFIFERKYCLFLEFLYGSLGRRGRRTSRRGWKVRRDQMHASKEGEEGWDGYNNPIFCHTQHLMQRRGEEKLFVSSSNSSNFFPPCSSLSPDPTFPVQESAACTVRS